MRTDRRVAGRVAGRRREAGVAVVEFTLVTVVLVALFLAVLQVAFVVHVRNTLVACAAEGARHAAAAGNGLAAGQARTSALVDDALSPSLDHEVQARTISLDGVAVVEVTVQATLPIVGVLGVSDALTVTGHALDEAAL